MKSQSFEKILKLHSIKFNKTINQHEGENEKLNDKIKLLKTETKF